MTEKPYSITNAHTDEESSNEGLAPQEDARQELRALHIMYERGLIPADQYEKRRAELNAIIND